MTHLRPGGVRHVVSAIALLALAAFPLAATAQTGSITGTVTDAGNGQPLSNAQVQAVGTTVGTTSNEAGVFGFDIAAGTHSVSVVLLGYQTVRVDGVSVEAGAATEITVELATRALSLNPIVVTVNRGREERTVASPAHVTVVSAEDVEESAGLASSDYVRGLPGVDVADMGIATSSVVSRGFNGVFSGSLLVLTDHRYARIPSLRLNQYSLIPTSSLDIERVEMLLGPAAALYGPNAGHGVMHLITSSPIDDPGTKVSLSGGERNVVQGEMRHSIRIGEKAGIKISGRYLTGNDFEYIDPAEVAASQIPGANPLTGQRDFQIENYTGELRLDLRPWENPDDEIVFTAGYANFSGINLTGLGSAQGKKWTYRTGHVRLSKGGLFAQGFYNLSGAGGTYLLRTGTPLVDNSNAVGAQLQYGFDLGSRLSFITGTDYAYTTPKTGGTIHGQFEDSDNTTEYGAYLHGQLELSDALKLVAVARTDSHEHLEDMIFTPRAAMVFEPADGQSFRLSYGSGFETPVSTRFFLDLAAGRVPLGGGLGYTVRTRGVNGGGYTWNNTCAGGVDNYCMYSPFAPGQLPANGAVLWDAVLLPLALTDPTLQAVIAQLGMTPEIFAQIVGNPQPGDIRSTLLRLNTENPEVPFFPDPGITDVEPLKPSVTTTYELGYNGIIGDRALLSVSAYRSSRDRTSGSLSTVTPNVFLDGVSVAEFLVGRLVAAGLPASVAAQVAQGLATTAAMVPLGTVAPDQLASPDILVTYPTFGSGVEGGLQWYGFDLGLEVIASDKVTFTGSYSHVSDDCFDINNDGECPDLVADVSLNAPKNKFSMGLRFNDKVSGWYANTRFRYADGFYMDSGLYRGAIDSFGVMDLGLGVRVPGHKGLLIGADVSNALNNLHREFIGAPEIGRVARLKLQYEF